MASRGSIILANSSNAFVGSSAGPSAGWMGGRSAVAVQATAYATSPGLQLQLQGPSGAWINIASSFLSDQLYVFDAAPGQYRVANQGSSSIGVNAVMIPIFYNL